MRKPHVCIACRLSRRPVSLRAESVGRRQWLSHSTSASQRSAGFDDSRYRAERDGYAGRVTRQELQPRELLAQLGDERLHQSRTRSERDWRQKHGVSSKAASNVPSPRLPPSIDTHVDEFCSGYAAQDHAVQLKSLRSLRNELQQIALSADERAVLERRIPSHRVRKVLDSVARLRFNSSGEGGADREDVRITDFVSELQQTGLMRPTHWGYVLLLQVSHVTGSLASGTQSLSSESTREAVADLTELWRLACWTGCRPNASIPGSDSVHWPSTSDLRASMKSEKGQRTVMLSDGLNLLFPSLRLLEDEGMATTLNKSAIMTFDLSRQFSAHAHSLSWYTAAQPFTDLIGDLLKNNKSNSTAILVSSNSETDERIQMYAEAMIDRLGMRNLIIEASLKSTQKRRKDRHPLEDAAIADSTSETESIRLLQGGEALFSSQSELPAGIGRKPLLGDKALRFKDTSMKRIARALEKTDLYAVQRVFKEVQSYPLLDGETLPLQLYELLILAFMSLRDPENAIATWNLIHQAGYQPTVRTWTAMMQGCQRARDVEAMENFWLRMRSQGTRPDAYAWSTRIFGLIRGKYVDKGLGALAEMGQEWLTAVRAQVLAQTKAGAKGVRTARSRAKVPAAADQVNITVADYPDDVDGVPRPNAVLMNTAISALANKDDHRIYQVLQWGKSFGIEPNMTTYNALLNIAMRHGRDVEAFEILEHMSRKGHKLDSDTFAVLLAAVFKSELLEGLAPQEQSDKVVGLMRALGNIGGAKIDQKGYATAIDRLLKQHSNAAGARAVLAHMQAQGVQPNAHIYTILMAHYFDSEIPDLQGVESLWQHIQTTNAGYGAILDTVFYDRMIEGYAKHHKTVGSAPMFKFLQLMSRDGKQPSWHALTLVAQALAERGEWSRLSEIVHDIRRGAAGFQMRGRVGQRRFWEVVISTGLLESEGVTLPSQIEVKGAGDLTSMANLG